MPTLSSYSRMFSRVVMGSSLLLGAGIQSPAQAQGFPALPPSITSTAEENFKEEKEALLPGLEMLIEGSILTKVLIPQYDAEKRLSSTLEAEKITLIDIGTIDAAGVNLNFYHPDESLRAKIKLRSARVQSRNDHNILRSTEQVNLQSEELVATGSGLIFEIQESRGLLLGPATANFSTKSLTAMNLPRPSTLTASALMFVAAPLAKAELPQKLDAQQVEGMDKLAVSNKPMADAAAKEAEKQLEIASTQAKEGSENLDDFLRRAAVDLPAGKVPDLSTAVPDPEIPPTKLPATIRAKDGIYFDSKSGLLTFLKDIEFTHPQFTLQGADEVKVFLEKSVQQTKNKSEESGKEGFNFGDPSKIIAVGTIVVERKKTPENKRMVKASGREMVYDLKSDELIIRGGQPWILSDTANGRVVDPKGYIRINLKSGDASFVGASKAFVETKGNE